MAVVNFGETKSAIIADSGTTSAEVDLSPYGHTLVGIIVPSTWTTASISFTASHRSGGTFYPVYNAAGAALATGSITGGTAVWIALDPADFAGIRFIKLVASASQSGGDTLTLITRAV